MSLALTRREREQIVIFDKKGKKLVELEVVQIKRGVPMKVRLAFRAHPDMKIMRKELLDEREDNEANGIRKGSRTKQ
tara:strand:- start:310 stop:540 length:231 start_codon:yes stop_codon:yes gene_type:complete